LKRNNSIHQNFSKIQNISNYVTNTAFSSTPVVHDIYCKYFNLVDLADRYWNRVEQKHQNHNWKSKMCFIIMRYQVINLWVYCCQSKFIEWKDFREKLAIFLQKFEK
jgi:hypothetical protein